MRTCEYPGAFPVAVVFIIPDSTLAMAGSFPHPCTPMLNLHLSQCHKHKPAEDTLFPIVQKWVYLFSAKRQ